MRYIGSKTSIASQVLDVIAAEAPGGTLCDPFGGVGTIAAAARARGYVVFSGDVLSLGVAFQAAKLSFRTRPQFAGLGARGLGSATEVVDALNRLPPTRGWVTEHYAVDRAFFLRENAERIDACRQQIESWRAANLITPLELKMLRASLIASADRVANTAGTYYAYLKALSRKARQAFRFELISPVSGPVGAARRCDARVRSSERSYDVLYLDPPYNARSYAGYYHLPETFARGDEPTVAGRAGVPRRAEPVSDFNAAGRATGALEQIVARSDCASIIFHYADGGLISLDDAHDILRSVGRVRGEMLSAPGYTVKRGARREVAHQLLIARA